MCSATMTALRGLRPAASTAAVLPGHELRFNVPGLPGVEPSWASVEPVGAAAGATLESTDENDDGEEATRKRRRRRKEQVSPVVHGVLYSLTEEDFAAVCRTEGVPLAYTLHRCRVVPYVGNGSDAGRLALEDSYSNINTGKARGKGSLPAYTLRAASKSLRAQPQSADEPPSRSYVNVLIRGAREFGLDREYVEGLETMPTGRTVWGDGTAERMLDAAIERRERRR